MVPSSDWAGGGKVQTDQPGDRLVSAEKITIKSVIRGRGLGVVGDLSFSVGA